MHDIVIPETGLCEGHQDDQILVFSPVLGTGASTATSRHRDANAPNLLYNIFLSMRSRLRERDRVFVSITSHPIPLCCTGAVLFLRKLPRGRGNGNNY